MENIVEPEVTPINNEGTEIIVTGVGAEDYTVADESEIDWSKL